MGLASDTNGTVLLVLQPRALAAAARVLSRARFVVLAATSQEEAAEVCRRYAGPIDVAVMDPSLERCGKTDVVPYLWALRPEMTLLYVASAQQRTLYESTGMHALVLFEPFSPEELVGAVTEIVRAGLPHRKVA